MKTIDVSKKVMSSVVRLERNRSEWWIRRFIFIVTALCVSIVALGYLAVRIISERQGWDLLTLFQQDPEIIASYWKDTLWIFWEESPHLVIFVLFIVFFIVIGVIVLTGQKRKILHKKFNQLDKYKTD